ncbi:hypothetical protein QJQ45_004256 [Haematococcus lacustris]|nr:hypothetical protein QJQ45_004256 [Haematococcus lacustris]
MKESRWRPLELCWWPEQTALLAKGKEYPGLGYKRVRVRLRPPRPSSSNSTLLRHSSVCPLLLQLTMSACRLYRL